jgi:uncharacterized phage protein (predicted DNA packaging)
VALTLDDLKSHCNVTVSFDDAVLTRLLAAATAHVERLLGFKLDDEDELPAGAPADLELAILQLAAHWYENREAVTLGVNAAPLPMGVADVVNEYRKYTFAAVDDE